MVSRLRLVRAPADAPAGRDPAADAELAAALARGDARAAVQAWRAYSVMVRGLVVRSLGPSTDVEDLVQSTFSIFFRKVPTLQNPAALRPFLIGIAIREVRGELRRRRVRRWLQLTSTGDLTEYFAASDDEGARHAFARLHRVLDALRTRERLAFALRHFEGYELLEIATALGCSLPTVKRVLAAAEGRVWALSARDPYLAPYLEPRGAKGRAAADRELAKPGATE